jgi:hypothetical protein
MISVASRRSSSVARISIVPSAEGGVSIYFMAGHRTAYVESYNQGSQALVMYDENGDVEVLEIGRDMPELI